MVDHGTVIYAIDRPSNTLGVLDAATGAYTAIGGTGATVGASGGLAFSEDCEELQEGVVRPGVYATDINIVPAV
jgi:YVTN family beta-propeller protein